MPKSHWFLASNHSILNLIGPCNTPHNTHSYKHPYAPTTLTNELFFFSRIVQKRKISQKCGKINSVFCGFMLVSNEETWLALFALGIEKPQPFTTLNVMGYFSLLFDIIFPMVNLSRGSPVTHTTPIFRRKRVIYHGKSVPRNCTYC